MSQEFSLDKWIEIGTIVSAQGVKGELKVYPDSDFPERFEKSGKRWLLSPDNQEIEERELIQGRCIPGKNLYVISLEGVTDRTEAEKLRGFKILVPKEDIPKLAEDEYHISHLIGLEVYHQADGTLLGNIVNVFWAGHDILEVQPVALNEQKIVNYLIPFVREIVPLVDLDKRRVEINPPPGLLEINKS